MADLQKYLEFSNVIDADQPAVRSLASELALGAENSFEIAKRCFNWVRDEVRHSVDHCDTIVTCSASQVLHHRTGFCYAKSHLLTALLRVNHIPTALCYQRLQLDDTGSSFCLHGLNAIYLEGLGWHRVDARGNRSEIFTQFSPPQEYLAFETSKVGEVTYAENWAAPLPVVVSALQCAKSCQELMMNLPDWVQN